MTDDLGLGPLAELAKWLADVIDGSAPPAPLLSLAPTLPDVLLEPGFEVRRAGARWEVTKRVLDIRRMTPDPGAEQLVVKSFSNEAAAIAYRDDALGRLYIPGMPVALPRVRLARRFVNPAAVGAAAGAAAGTAAPPADAVGSIDFRDDPDAKAIHAHVEEMLQLSPRFAHLTAFPDGARSYVIGTEWLPTDNPGFRLGGITRPPAGIPVSTATRPRTQVILNPVGVKSRFDLASDLAHELAHAEAIEAAGFFPHHVGSLLTEEEFVLFTLCSEYDAYFAQTTFERGVALALGAQVESWVRGQHESSESHPSPGPDSSPSQLLDARRAIRDRYREASRAVYVEFKTKDPIAYAVDAVQEWRDRPMDASGLKSSSLAAMLTQTEVWLDVDAMAF